MERLIPQIEGQPYGVILLALMMTHLEALAAVQKFPEEAMDVRGKYFITVGMEVLVKVTNAAYDKTPNELRRWLAEHERTMCQLRPVDNNTRRM